MSPEYHTPVWLSVLCFVLAAYCLYLRVKVGTHTNNNQHFYLVRHTLDKWHAGLSQEQAFAWLNGAGWHVVPLPVPEGLVQAIAASVVEAVKSNQELSTARLPSGRDWYTEMVSYATNRPTAYLKFCHRKGCEITAVQAAQWLVLETNLRHFRAT